MLPGCRRSPWWGSCGRRHPSGGLMLVLLAGQGKKNRMKKLVDKVNPGRSHTDYRHKQNGLNLGETHLIFLPVKKGVGWILPPHTWPCSIRSFVRKTSNLCLQDSEFSSAGFAFLLLVGLIFQFFYAMQIPTSCASAFATYLQVPSMK